jgi:hypothetical protein
LPEVVLGVIRKPRIRAIGANLVPKHREAS